jgi:hypothetical protein
MRLPRLLTLAIAAAVALAAGCEGRPPKAAEGRDVIRPALGFALDVPEGWTWRDLDGDVVLEVFRQEAPAGPQTKGAADAGAAAKRTRPVIHIVVVDRAGATPETWADDAVASSREIQADLEVAGREPATLADGRDALALTLKNPRGLEPIVQRMVLAVTGKRAYALMVTAPESDMARIGPEVEACFRTFVVW